MSNAVEDVFGGEIWIKVVLRLWTEQGTIGGEGKRWKVSDYV